MPGRKLHIAILFCAALIIAHAGVLSASDREIYVVKFPLKGPIVAKWLDDRGIEILSFGRDGTVDVAVDARELDYIYSLGARLGVPVSVIQTPDMVSSLAALDENLGLYHTYAEMESVLTDLSTNYSGLTQLSIIGTSLEGRNIYMLKISDNPGLDESEPEVLIVSNLHAREIMTVEITLKFAIYLLENYGTDATVTALVDDREIFIGPMLNPDGHVYVEQNHGGSPGGWWRKNRRPNSGGSFGVDLNRNFGFQWGYDNIGSSPSQSSATYRGTAPFSEPETQVLRDFCEGRDFIMSFSYHSYGELLLYGWGYYYGYTPDHALFLALGDELTGTNGYFPGNPAMGAIYITNGSSDDWFYGEQITKNKTFAFTPEVNNSAQGGFGPAESYIQPTFDLLLPMNMQLLELAANPYQVVGPFRPTMLSVQTPSPPSYTLSWSDNDPSDPNPVTSWEVIEYANYHMVSVDPANGPSPLWEFDVFAPTTARAHEGTGSFYSGNSLNNTTATLTAATFYRVTPSTQTFSCWIWYDIEPDWDYAYADVSTDGGVIWQPIAGSHTTNTNPHGNNRGNGITGQTVGWELATFPLDSYVGEDILIRWSYVTDSYVLHEGIYIDELSPVPTADSVSVIASGHTDPWLFIAPQQAGDFTYTVRAEDGEGDMSAWSNSVDHTVSEVVTGVGDPPRFETALGANYPNPFNPVTNIPYAVRGAAGEGAVPVELAIFDVTGRRVATIVSREVPPGLYTAVWRGLSDRGDPVSSGVYFARLSVGSERPFYRKLVLLK